MAKTQASPKPIRNPKRASEQDVVFCPGCGAMLDLAQLERMLRPREQHQERAPENAPEPAGEARPWDEAKPSGDAQASDQARPSDQGKARVQAGAGDCADLAIDDVDEPTRVLDRSVASDLAQATAAADDSGDEIPDISVFAMPYPPESVSAAEDIGNATGFDGIPSSGTTPGIGGEIPSKDEAAVSGSADSQGAAMSVGVAITEDATESADPAGRESRTTTIGMGAPQVAAPTADPARATSRTTTTGMGAPQVAAPTADPARATGKTTTSSDARNLYRATPPPKALDRAVERDVSARPQFSGAPVARDAIPAPQRKSNRLVGFGLGAAALGAAFGLYSHMQPGNPSIRETAAVAVRVPVETAPRELTAFEPAANEQAAGEAEPETEPAEEEKAPGFAAAVVARAKLARATPEKTAVPRAVRAAVDTKPSPKPSVARKAPAAAPREVSPVAKAEASSAPEPEAKPAAFNTHVAASRLNAAAARSSTCRAAGDPSGQAVVTITFAPSGRVTAANVAGQRFAGTATGSCIASMMRTVKVPAFEGAHVTVRKRVTIR
jgi:hypothetical protein